MNAELQRVYGEKETTGTLSFFDNTGKLLYSCKTVELPDKNNIPQVSCIPEGRYDVIVVPNSPAIKYEHLHITNVKNRQGIKIHVANYVTELRGCIAPGKSLVDMNKDGLLDVASSTQALKEILTLCKEQGYNSTNHNNFFLTIKKAETIS